MYANYCSLTIKELLPIKDNREDKIHAIEKDLARLSRRLKPYYTKLKAADERDLGRLAIKALTAHHEEDVRDKIK